MGLLGNIHYLLSERLHFSVELLYSCSGLGGFLAACACLFKLLLQCLNFCFQLSNLLLSPADAYLL